MDSLATAVDSLAVSGTDLVSEESQQSGQQQLMLNGLPQVVITHVARFLPLPDLYNLRQVNKKFRVTISDRDINEAKRRYLVKFKHLKKVPDSAGIQYHGQLRQYQIGSDGQVICETITDPVIKVLLGALTLSGYSNRNKSAYKLTGCGLNDTASVHLGQLENGLYFIMALNPDMIGNFFQFFSAFQMILYVGDRTPGYTGENALSMYCGRSCETAIRALELACRGQDIASHVRDLLGFEKTYY